MPDPLGPIRDLASRSIYFSVLYYNVHTLLHIALSGFLTMEHITPIQLSSWPSALGAARRQLRMSQRSLSSRTGLPQGHISRIESGAVDPRLSSATKIARTLGFEPMLIPRRALPVVLGILREFDPSATQRRPSAIELLVGDGEQDE